jgi:DNA polymerase
MARASVKKFYAFERNTDLEDNRIRDGLVYHLSHTGRWGSRGSQLLNLVKYSGNMDLLCHSIKTCDKEFLDAYWGSANHAISDAPRGALIASKDKDFFCVDFSAIEARTLFFIARDMRGLLQFMKKEDLYVSLARLIYEDETITKETHPDERQLGKQGVLGCGYQMGWERFIETCASYGMDVSEELAKKTVTMYREAYQPVVDFWWACDKAAKKAINYRTIVEVGPIAFGYSQGALMVRLPSGKFLYYHNPKVKKREVTEEQRADLIARGLEWKLEREVIVYSHQNDKNMWVTTHTYGGKLVENINQAVARDLLGYSLLNVMKTKRYTPLLLPHDELLTEGDPKECSVEELCELVCKLPPWAEGLPMAAEGWTGKRYRK